MIMISGSTLKPYEMILDGEHILMLESIVIAQFSRENTDKFRAILCEGANKLAEAITLHSQYPLYVSGHDDSLAGFKKAVLSHNWDDFEGLKEGIEKIVGQRVRMSFPESFETDMEIIAAFFGCDITYGFLPLIRFLTLSIEVDYCSDQFVFTHKKQNGKVKIHSVRNFWDEIATNPNLPLCLCNDW
jgi:hypothetical protein